jgi:hypothetical protein
VKQFDEVGWMNFSALVDKHIGLSLRKQLALADFLGKHSWQLSLSAGTVDFGKTSLFGKRRIYPIQVLGSEAEKSGTWLWAWANSESNIPPAVLRAVNHVKSFGESQAIPELVTPELSTSKHPGHLLAMVCAGIADADCYYRGPHAGGAVFFLVFETSLREAPPTSSLGVANVMIQVISQFEVNHRAMAKAYLGAEGFRVVEEDSALKASADDGRALQVVFNDRGLISGVKTVVGPRR